MGPGCSAPISHPANPEYFCRELPSSDSCLPGSGPHPPGPTTEARLSPLAPTQHCPHHGHLPVRADSSALRAPASSRPPCWSQSDACSDTPFLPPGPFSGLCLEAPSWENPAAGPSHAPPTHCEVPSGSRRAKAFEAEQLPRCSPKGQERGGIHEALIAEVQRLPRGPVVSGTQAGWAEGRTQTGHEGCSGLCSHRGECGLGLPWPGPRPQAAKLFAKLRLLSHTAPSVWDSAGARGVSTSLTGGFLGCADVHTHEFAGASAVALQAVALLSPSGAGPQEGGLELSSKDPKSLFCPQKT